jgi:hypothetical protein
MDVIAGVALRNMGKKVDQRQNQPRREDREDEEVKHRVPASVIGKTLGLIFGHGMLLAERRASVAEIGQNPSMALTCLCFGFAILGSSRGRTGQSGQIVIGCKLLRTI